MGHVERAGFARDVYAVGDMGTHIIRSLLH